MQLPLPEKITNKLEAIEYIDMLFHHNMSYDIVESANDVEWTTPPNDSEKLIMDELSDQIFELDDFDPHNYILLKLEKIKLTESISSTNVCGLLSESARIAMKENREDEHIQMWVDQYNHPNSKPNVIKTLGSELVDKLELIINWKI